MKRLYGILYVFSLMAAVACSRNDAADVMNKTISAAFPDVLESKVFLSEKSDDTGLSLSWEQSDKLVVVGESVETYTLKTIDGKKATFTGKEVEGSVFDVVLSSCDNYEDRSYLSQRQTGVQSTDHLEYDACLKGVDTYSDVRFTQEWAAEHGGELLQSGCILLYLQLPVSASKVTRVKVEASSPTFYATNSESSLKSSSLVLDVDDGVVGVDRTVKAYMMTSMHESVIEAGTTLRITVETDMGIYCKDAVPGKVSLLPGKRNVLKLNSSNWKPLVEYGNFTFMTYNVGKFRKYVDKLGHDSYPEVASIIRYYGADIVGLNEIGVTSTSNNQPERLLAEMGNGWKYYFAPAEGENYGNAVLASPSLKELNRTKVDMPCITEGYQSRSLAVVEYEDFVFCVTHLDHHSRKERAPQIKKINDWVKASYGKPDKPVILVGDMNATPGSPEIKGNSDEIEGLGDCWQVISVTGTKPDYVVTYPANSSCLDYIFLWKNDAVEYTVSKTEVVSFCPGLDVSLVSDHYPVYVDVTFRKTYAVEGIKGLSQAGECHISEARSH